MKPRDFITGVLIAAMAFLPLAARAQMTDRDQDQRADRWSATHASGVIAVVQGSSLQLDNGRVVFLHPRTVINPTRTKLRPGMWIAVLGAPSSKDAIDASEIDVGPGPGMVVQGDLYHATYARGRIVSIQGSSLQLDNGRVIFLHPRTEIAPTGATLQVGMMVEVLGSPSNSQGAIDANEVRIAGTSASGNR